MSTTLETGTCRSCGAGVLWGITANGARQPLDPDLVLVPDGEPDRMLVNLNADNRLVSKKCRRGFVPHHATCPQGRAWRRKP